MDKTTPTVVEARFRVWLKALIHPHDESEQSVQADVDAFEAALVEFENAVRADERSKAGK